MALFDEQVSALRGFLKGAAARGLAREFRAGERAPWPGGPSLVLEEDTAVELGNPSLASLSMLVWSEGRDVRDGTVTLVGPDIGETADGSIPFAQVVVAGGAFADEYGSYREIRDAVYDTRLSGLSVRTMPSRQSMWCRVGRDAAGAGLSLVDLGSALVDSLHGVEGVTAAEVVFVTSSAEDVKELAPAAAGAQRLIDAMMKMYQEQTYDCDTCEYQDVCDTVMDLKEIRKKLEQKRAGSA